MAKVAKETKGHETMNTKPKAWTARRIKGLRTRARLSQEGLAAALGVTTSTVSRWERRTHKPDPRAALALDALDRETA